MGRVVTPRASAGFTLVELLVATAVLAVLTVGAVLRLGAAPPPSDMVRFERAYDMQQALATATRQRRGLYVTRQSLQVALWQDGAWVESGPPIDWQGQVVPDARLPGPRNRPDVVILHTGQSTPIRLIFAGVGACESDGQTGLTCSAR